MIVTVTMNPAIDKTIDIDELLVGTLNRIKNVYNDAGGKGINVSKTIKAIGGTSIATGFLGGNAGKNIENILKSLDIDCDFVFVDGETRTNTKVVTTNGSVTELNEQGLSISDRELETLLSKLEGYARQDTIFVLAGSIPKGVPKDTYKKITEIAHSKGSRVILDADGELFSNTLGATPNLIKPNREELAEFANISGDITKEQILQISDKFLQTGIEMVVVSMGKDGALFLTKDKKAMCQGLKVKAHSTVGAGDAMVAGLSYSLDNNLDFEEMLKLCVATSAGAVTTVGTKPPSREVIDDLIKQVTIDMIGE